MRTRSRIDPRRTPSARPPQLGSASQWKVAPPSTSGRGCRWDRKRKAAAMVLHKVPPRLWPKLRLQEGICARLPAHFLAQLNDDTQPTPVHWRPLGVRYRRNPRTGERERVQDVPVPVFLPRAADEGLWGGEGWIRGFRYANNDKVRLPAGLGSARLGSVRFGSDSALPTRSSPRECQRSGSRSCSSGSSTARSWTPSSPSPSLCARWTSSTRPMASTSTS